MADDGLSDKVNALEAQLQNIKSLLTSNGAEVNGSPSPASENLAAVRLQLLELAHNLEYAALGPTEWLKASFAVTKYDHLAYYALSQFPIHEHIPLTGSISYQALSTASGMPLGPLKRVLRHLMLNHLFTEPEPGQVAHSEASRILVTEPGMASWLGHNYDEVFRSFGLFAEALKKGDDEGHPGKTATALAFDQPRGFFGGLLAQEPWRAKRFAEAMQAMTRGSHDHSYLVTGYDWAQYGNGLVVDVGGSSGFQSLAIATAYPTLNFIVQDIEDLSSRLEENMSALTQRPKIKFQVHDFFTPNAESSADVYFLRHIIHDWSDSYAAKILRNIASVMKRSARIVVMDIVVPERGVLPFLDLQMMVVVNGKERNRQEWDELLALADPRLRILSVRQPQNSVASIIEIGLVE
ncbi:O-methyltransferase-domain-containing protein [Aspergillus carlsbadensis]|nr:O-methyltransferase-domain-containing protein [Aspergillus carlsbadensis]